MPVTQHDLDWFAARLSIAVHETRKLTPEMSVADLREALKDIPGASSLTVSYAPGGNQIISIGEKSVEVSPMASNDEIRAALQNPFIRTENTKVSITGALDLKAKFEAAKARKAALEARAEAALNTYNSSAELAESAVKSLEDDAAALQAEVAQFSNGAPE